MESARITNTEGFDVKQEYDVDDTFNFDGTDDFSTEYANEEDDLVEGKNAFSYFSDQETNFHYSLITDDSGSDFEVKNEVCDLPKRSSSRAKSVPKYLNPSVTIERIPKSETSTVKKKPAKSSKSKFLIAFICFSLI